MPEPQRRRRVAVVLFNLGGPDSPAAVRPYLLNLFRDPAILRVPFYVRPFLARRIAAGRLAAAQAIYARLGGRSPLLDHTQAQAEALEAALPELDARCFIAMRYWHPTSLETAREVKAWAPDQVVLLPLYPQFSSTTTGSSLAAWRLAASKIGLIAEVCTLCCYPADEAFAGAMARGVARTYEDARRTMPEGIPLRVLFSAHGLPEAIVKAGDPYQWQVAHCVAAVLRHWGAEGIESRICYQSRATPQKWLEPSTEQEIEHAARDKAAVLVVPIAFVSDHSETLVELDVEYRELAERLGVPGYFRAPTQNAEAGFIAALAGLVRRMVGSGPGIASAEGRRICPAECGMCPLALPASVEA